MNSQEKEDAITLEILQTIENKSDVSQRILADNMGVALGLANSYLKRCVRKGYIKIQQIPANRYLYYLTPQGFAEKSRLTASYLSHSFNFYRRAGESCSEIFKTACDQGYSRLIFCGISELAEIASLRSQEFGLNFVGTLEQGGAKKHFLGKPVFDGFDKIPQCDAFVLTSIVDTAEKYQSLLQQVEKDRILVPEILGINNH